MAAKEAKQTKTIKKDVFGQRARKRIVPNNTAGSSTNRVLAKTLGLLKGPNNRLFCQIGSAATTPKYQSRDRDRPAQTAGKVPFPGRAIRMTKRSGSRRSTYFKSTTGWPLLKGIVKAVVPKKMTMATTVCQTMDVFHSVPMTDRPSFLQRITCVTKDAVISEPDPAPQLRANKKIGTYGRYVCSNVRQ